MLSTSERDRRTEEAMNDPQPGDRFTEMYSFWIYVVSRLGNFVVTFEGSPPCTFPEDGKQKCCTCEEFRQRFAYKSIPGYSISLVDRGNDVEGWLQGLEGGTT